MKRLLLEDLRLKLFSMGIALVLYVFITYEAGTPVVLDVPLKVETATDIAISSDLPAKLRVTYRGAWASLRSLDRSLAPPYVIPLQDQAPGPVTLNLFPEMMPRLPGMEAVMVQPSMIDLRLDRLIERQLPIRAELRGMPAQGYVVGDILLHPTMVTVRGPALDVERIGRILTKPLDISGASSAVATEVELREPAFPVTLRDRGVKVSITVVIEEEFVDRYLKTIPVSLLEDEPGLLLRTRSVAGTIRGPLQALKAIDSRAIRAVVSVGDVDNLAAGVLELVPELEGLPERAYLVGPSPTVAVEYRPGRRGRKKRR